jgi:hypothetical protein
MRCQRGVEARDCGGAGLGGQLQAQRVDLGRCRSAQHHPPQTKGECQQRRERTPWQLRVAQCRMQRRDLQDRSMQTGVVGRRREHDALGNRVGLQDFHAHLPVAGGSIWHRPQAARRLRRTNGHGRRVNGAGRGVESMT